MSTINHDERGHRFTTDIDGHHALLDYTLRAEVMTITHTRVPEAIGGRGVAGQLMKAALAAATDRGWQVVPQCSYAVTYMRKHAQEDKQHVDALLDEALDESFPASDSPSVGGST